MKSKILPFLVIVAFCSLVSIRVFAENRKEIVLEDGRVLKNAYIISRTPSGLNVGHDKGVIFIPFSEMSKERQKYYHYDPEKAKAYEERITKAQVKRQTRLAKKRAEEKKDDEEAFDYQFTSFSVLSPVDRLKQELASLLAEKRKLEKERTQVINGNVLPAGGPSDGSYTSYRGGKVSHKSYTGMAAQNVTDKKRRLKEIRFALEQNSRRTTTVRNLLREAQFKGVKNKKSKKY